MNNNIMNMAMNLLAKNPQVTNNPMAQPMINAIKTGNAQVGEQIANNICQSYGCSKEELLAQAKSYFGIG